MVDPTTVLIGLMVGLFFLNSNLPGFNFEPLNYLARSFYHADLSHLVINMISLWQLSRLQGELGTTEFSKLVIFLVVASSLIHYGIHSLFPETKRLAVGFSAVLFGLLIVGNYLVSGRLLAISGKAIWGILPQFLVPGISFWGHLSGILSGILYLVLSEGRAISV